MPQPNNSDLLVEIRSNHKEVVTRLGAVEEQVKHTNGRVRTLEADKLERDAINKYKKENPTVTINSESTQVRWFGSPEGKKLLLALATLALAAAAYLSLASQGAR